MRKLNYKSLLLIIFFALAELCILTSAFAQIKGDMNTDGTVYFGSSARNSYTVTLSSGGPAIDLARPMFHENIQHAGIEDIFRAPCVPPLGDINNNETIELGDTILALQIVVQISPAADINLQGDVNNDGRIGLVEALYTLQCIAVNDNDFEEIVIGPQGGDFNLPNGITLSIPQGAVPEATTFQFRSVQEKEFSMPTEYFRQYEKHFLTGIEAKPYGYTFNQPISISIPSPGLVSSTSLPYPLSLNTATNELAPIGGSSLKAIAKEENFSQFLAPMDTFGIGLKAIYVNEDGSIGILDLTGLPEDQKAIVLLDVEKIKAESDCVSNPCRCRRIKVESDDFDSVSSVDGCYSVYSDGFVQFLDCPGQPIEPWSLHESNLDVTVIPNNEKIKVGEIVYFSISLTDEKSQPVTDFLIQELNIENSSVISEWNIGDDFIGIKGLSSGISSAEVVIQSGGCQYKGWLTVDVVQNSIVLTSNNMNIPEGESMSVGVKLSDAPPVTQEIKVSALVGGDNSISVVSSMPLSFNHSNWDTYQDLLIAAAEDADTSSDTATITVTPDVDYCLPGDISVKEIDNDFPDMNGSWEEVVTEGGQTCTITAGGVEIIGEDWYDVILPIEVTHTDTDIAAYNTHFPGSDPHTGSLKFNSDPAFPYSFSMSVSSANTVDCISFFQSNGEDIVFGQPACGGDVECTPLTCFETEIVEGVISADADSFSGTSLHTFEATANAREWDGDSWVYYPNARIECEGGSYITGTRQ